MKILPITAAFLLLSLGVAGRAAITIDTVTVGNPGNTCDTTGHGSVSYTYNIGKYEVTAGQYCAFLNAVAKSDTYGLYNSNMWTGTYGCKIQQTGDSGSYSYNVASDYANRPVNYVSFWNACRFVNWLSNGQKIGAQDGTTTENGAYALDGYNSTDGRAICRNAGASWTLPSEDEWYKAAFYKGDGTNSGYWKYETQSDAISPSMANYNFTKGTTDVGFYQYTSPYGAYDMGGNVWEWDEAVLYVSDSYSCRGLRGGSFASYSTNLISSAFNDHKPSLLDGSYGFRVVQLVPEPSSLLGLLTGLAVVGSAIRRRTQQY